VGSAPHGCVLVVDRLESGQVVEWRCVRANPGLPPADACVGTHVRFHISRNETGSTQMQINHRGWTSKNTCFDAWERHWIRLAGRSLKSYLETGLGEPVC